MPNQTPDTPAVDYAALAAGDPIIRLYAHSQYIDEDNTEVPTGLVGINIDGHFIGWVSPDTARNFATELESVANDAEGK